VERWKIFAGMTLLVAFGFLCGAVAASYWWGRFAERGQHGRLSALLTPEVAEELGLDARQRVAFEAVIGEARGRLLLLMRQEFRPRAEAILDGAYKRLEAVLQPEQRERLRTFRREHTRREEGSSRTSPSRHESAPTPG
jgi:hypothetical protein